MRIAVLAIVSGVVLSFSAPVLAATSGEAQPVSASQSSDPSQKIVCKYVAHEGTVLPKPVCATQYAWDKQRRDEQQQIREMQERSLQFNTTPR